MADYCFDPTFLSAVFEHCYYITSVLSVLFTVYSKNLKENESMVSFVSERYTGGITELNV